MIRRCDERDFEEIHAIINDGARVYEGVIPRDRWKDPYMSREELRLQVQEGVEFWGYHDEAGALTGVMGLQALPDVTLIRHAYVRGSSQKQGIGRQLLAHLRTLAPGAVLIGTWADAAWAIRFYEKNGFEIVSPGEKDQLLRRYWNIPERQIETSVVLADAEWRRRRQAEVRSASRSDTPNR